MVNRREFLMAAGAPAWQPQTGASGPVCPKSKAPARTLFAMRLEDLTTASSDMRLTLTCLQGLVNRSQPQLYLVQDRYDQLWLDWLRERGDIDDVRWLEVGQVFERFMGAASVLFIADPEMPATVNVATMLAGVRGGLVATPRTASQYKLPVALDLRKMGWKKNVEAYKWAMAELGHGLSRRAVSWMDPATVALRDYLVEFRIPVLWVTGLADARRSPFASPEEERQFARDVFMQWPPNIPCLGWPGDGQGLEHGIGEREGVALASECAKFQICSSWDGFSPAISNVSVHSGTSATLRQKPAPAVLARDKVYVALVRTDGDGWNFHRHYYRKLFGDPQHGRYPMSWHVGPTALDAIPDLIDYFYRHASPGDYFLNALTGIGYIHEFRYARNYPEKQAGQILRDYIRLSAPYFERLDTRVLVTFAEMQPERLKQFAGLPGLAGVFANMHRAQDWGLPGKTTLENLVSECGGIPVIRAAASGRFSGMTFTPSGRRDAEAFLLNEIREWTPRYRPAFLYIPLTNWFTHMQIGENVIRALGPEYVPVRADQLIDLRRQSVG